MSERQEFIEGTDAVVECPAFLGAPPGSMIWSRDNMAINDDRFILEDGRLTIQDIRAGDGDVYQCSINRHGIRGTKSITVVVRERNEVVPNIVEPMGPIEVMYGAPLDLTCQLEEPRDNVRYPAVRNNEDDHSTTTLSGSGTVSTLTIHGVGRGDAGQYTCSYPGLNSISITLVVIGKLL